MEMAALFTKTTDLVCTSGVELGTGESLKETSDPSTASSEGRNDIGIIPFYDAFREEQVPVVKIFHLLIHNNTYIDY